MQSRRVNDEVYYAEGPLVALTRQDLEDLKAKAAANPRHRARLCAHSAPGDVHHDMVIAMTRDAYVRPHRHLGKVESYHVIEGEADALSFADDGRLVGAVRMGDLASGKVFFHRSRERTYHAFAVRSSFFVFHESTNGPFEPTQSQFAPWAPEDSDPIAVRRFLDGARKDAERSTRQE